MKFCPGLYQNLNPQFNSIHPQPQSPISKNKMGSKGLVLVKGASYSSAVAMCHRFFHNCNTSSSRSTLPKVATITHHHKLRMCSSSSSSSSITTTPRSSLQPPDVSSLAKTAQISLTSNEVEEFAPKILQVIDWFGQLQGVDLQSIEPSIRAETENNLRDNAPETFDHRDAMISAVPSYEEPYIKVPRVLSTE